MRTSHLFGLGVLAFAVLLVWLMGRVAIIVLGLLGFAIIILALAGNLLAADTIPDDWLQRRVDVADAGVSQATDEWKTSWTGFLSHLEDGDEVWQFSSPAHTWRNLHGQEGFVIVRRGRPTSHTIITCMN